MTDKEKLEAIRAEIERLKKDWQCYLRYSVESKYRTEAYTELIDFIDSIPEEPVSNDFEMALAEMIAKAQTSVVEPWVIAAQWKDELIKLAKSEEPISDELEEAATKYAQDKYMPVQTSQAFKAGAKWKEANLWKPADGNDLPDIDREVIALTQPFPDDDEHLRVVFAHRPTKYTKVWNSDLGEEQVVEIERYGKGEWNIPNAKYWLDVELPKEIEL